MKKIFISLFTAAALFTACNSSDDVQPETTGTGTLSGQIVFQTAPGGTRAAESNAIPVTSWSNIKNMKLLLSNASGVKLVRDLTVPATAGTATFTFANLPVDIYTVTVVANATMGTNDVQTTVDGGTSFTPWTASSLIGKSFTGATPQAFIDLKPGSFVADYPHTATNLPYNQAEEVFTAFATGVSIDPNGTTTLDGGNALKLKRDVSLLRVRVDKTGAGDAALTAALAQVNFVHNGSSSIMLQTVPKGLGLDVLDLASNDKRIIVYKDASKTFHTTNVTAGYDPGAQQIPTGSKYSLWQDIRVLSNTARNTQDPDKVIARVPAAAGKKYTLIITAYVPNGYKTQDGVVMGDNSGLPKTNPTNTIFWKGTINDASINNVILETNVILKTKGEPLDSVIVGVTQEGTLEIEVKDPLPWNSNIQDTQVEM